VTERLRVGIIGAGNIVEDAHLPALLNVPLADVRWVADQRPQRAEMLSTMYGVSARRLDGAASGPMPPRSSVARSLDALDTLLDEVDACLLAVPVGARDAYYDRCAERGTALIAEKPFARSGDAHEALCARYPAHKLGVCFQRRHYAAVLAARHALQSGMFGKLERIDLAAGGVFIRSGGSSRYLTDPRLSGGGVIMDLAVHAFDQALFASGATAVAVDRVSGIAQNGIDFDATVEGTVTDAGGPVAFHAEVSRLRPLDQGITFTTEHAVLRLGALPDVPLLVSPRGGGPAMKLAPPGRAATTAGQAFFLLWETFLTGLQRKERNAASAVDALLTSRLVDGIYTAMGLVR
jgi:predicted dehydrogenase